MNVLVYSGPEVIQTSLSHTLTVLRSLLLPNYTVQAISAQSLANHPWSATCALIVFPTCYGASSSSKAFQAVKTYVEIGGRYLGLSSGALFASKAVTDINALRLDDKTAGNFTSPTFRTEGESRLIDLRFPSEESVQAVYQDGGGDFNGVEDMKNVKILARYVDERVAAVSYQITGGGKAVFWSPSLEYPLTTEPASSAFIRDSVTLSADEIQIAERCRLRLFRDTLRELGLNLPEDTKPVTPLPQFLVAPSSRRDIIPQILGAIGLQLPTGTSAPGIFADTNDTFHFHPFSSALTVLQSARARLIDNSEKPDSDIKDIIVCAESCPSQELTPLFNSERYFSRLASVRHEIDSDLSEGSWGIGEALLYGEVVTSTQTMLDKNPRLLGSIPSPLVLIANYQLAGRGRGGNVWLSPRGSLPISLLIRPPLNLIPTHKLVFIQYLFCLAVTEACRDNDVLGKWGDAVRIKWPNDIYAVVGGENKKIGGILVNTNFGSGKVEAVIGCGVNVSNALPTTSLAQLVPPDTEIAAKLCLESTAAIILAKFEAMWSTFLSNRGSFEPFMDLYLERWLHSDQLVTVTTTNPHRTVRICGITPDHGLLRTIPERDGWSRGVEEFIDLQPDGNSFDMMKGLIKTKT